MAENDSVLTWMPLALSATSMPLACQKRVFRRTKRSYGAFTNTRTLNPLPSSSSSYAITSPTSSRRKYTGVPKVIEPRLSARNLYSLPGRPAVSTGGTSSPTKLRRAAFDSPSSRPM